jgi:hypothetical protein
MLGGGNEVRRHAAGVDVHIIARMLLNVLAMLGRHKTAHLVLVVLAANRGNKETAGAL